MENKIYKDFITEGLKEFESSSPLRFAMPGHKGNFTHPILNDILKYDVTELSSTDDLYAPCQMIQKSENQATEFYGTKNTVFSPFGATSCIFTMLYIYKILKKGKSLLVDRCSHKSVFNALGILDISCQYIYPDTISNFSISNTVSLENIKSSFKDDIGGILITSPNYYGLVSNIEEISNFCKEKDIFLMVDNSHGSHFYFTDQKNLHPLSHNATFCVDSIHKTLPVATGGALLHCNLDIDKDFIKNSMGIFYSSSPSYLLMSSMDSGLAFMFNNGKELYSNFKEKVLNFKKEIKNSGYTILENQFFDDYKILINLKNKNITGYELLELMNEKNIYAEMCDEENVLLMLSPFNKDSDFKKYIDFLKDISVSEKTNISNKYEHMYNKREKALSLNECIFSQSETIKISESNGRICKNMIYDYPPGIPIIVPGEIINSDVIDLLKEKGYEEITVIK